MLIIEDATVIVKCKTAIKVLFLFFNLCMFIYIHILYYKRIITQWMKQFVKFIKLSCGINTAILLDYNIQVTQQHILQSLINHIKQP